MTKPSFLARTTLGQPRYLLLALACVFVLALAPRGAYRALEGATASADAWLPESYGEVQDLAWFRDHFRGEQFALVSWDGCTLGNSEHLELLAKKLAPTAETLARAGEKSAEATRARWYARVVTGPQVIRQLMQSQVGLSYAAAIKRLEGALVGPPARDAQGRTLGNDTRTT
ncbi:MAG TPA: hypothetical protein VEQ85_15955, partial [Lacipirellulaceae bacterium]|nr:hypothetical protein [Lacipirellulaceae bacterium]